jgi:flagellar protein FlaG
MDISSVDLQRSLSGIVAPQPVPQEQVAERKQLIQAVREVNKSDMLGENNELTFVMDRKTRKALVRVVNKETNEVVLQIPPEYVLRMAEELKRDS